MNPLARLRCRRIYLDSPGAAGPSPAQANSSAHGGQSLLRGLRNLAFISLVLVLTGCRVALSTFNPHGPAAHRIANLAWIMTILFLVISVVMWILFAFAFYRRRGSLAEHEPVESGGGEMWIAIGGFVVPFIVLTALFVAGLSLLSDFPMHGAEARPGLTRAQLAQTMKPQIQIIGHQWWWEIRYLSDDPSKEFTTANELHLPAGQPVNIEVTSADVIHAFWIPALDGKIDLIPGQPNYIRLIASQPGTYAGQCATYCGVQHALMRLLAVVQSPADYQAWLQSQAQPGAVPATPQAQAGEEIFVSTRCAQCHTVRGTRADGAFAPDLTHIGSRRMLASDVYPNNNAYLEAWIANAQSLKPGCKMPNLPQYSGVQLTELVAYLRQLK